MKRDRKLEKLTREGIELMRREREAALKGDFQALEAINAQKTDYLCRLEALAAENESGGPQPLQKARRHELASLFTILRRRAEENQILLKAAEAGVKQASQRLQAILNSDAPSVGYNSHGKKIESKSLSTKTLKFI